MQWCPGVDYLCDVKRTTRTHRQSEDPNTHIHSPWGSTHTHTHTHTHTRAPYLTLSCGICWAEELQRGKEKERRRNLLQSFFNNILTTLNDCMTLQLLALKILINDGVWYRVALAYSGYTVYICAAKQINNTSWPNKTNETGALNQTSLRDRPIVGDEYNDTEPKCPEGN